MRTLAHLPPPRIEYVGLDDDAPTLKKPSLSAEGARAVLEEKRDESIVEKAPTLRPLSIDATVERFVASPIADPSYDDFDPLPPYAANEGSHSVRFAGVVALFVVIALGFATLGAAAARVQARPADLSITWIGNTLPGR